MTEHQHLRRALVKGEALALERPEEGGPTAQKVCSGGTSREQSHLHAWKPTACAQKTDKEKTRKQQFGNQGQLCRSTMFSEERGKLLEQDLDVIKK